MVLEWLRQGFQNVASGIQNAVSEIQNTVSSQIQNVIASLSQSSQQSGSEGSSDRYFDPFVPPSGIQTQVQLSEVQVPSTTTVSDQMPKHIQEAVKKAEAEGKRVEVVSVRPEVKIPSPEELDPFRSATKEELEKIVKEAPDPNVVNEQIIAFNKRVEEFERKKSELDKVTEQLEKLETRLEIAKLRAEITGDYTEYDKVYSEYEKYYKETYLPLYEKLKTEHEELSKIHSELESKKEAVEKAQRAEMRLALLHEKEEQPFYSPIARQAGRPFPIPGMLGDIFDVVGTSLGLYQPKKEEMERVAKYEREFVTTSPVYAKFLEAQEFFEKKFVEEPLRRFEREDLAGKIILAPAVAGGVLAGGTGIWLSEAGKMFSAASAGLGKSFLELIEGRPEEVQKTIQKTTELTLRSGAEFATDLLLGIGIGKALSKGFTAVAPYAALPFEKGYKIAKPVIEPVAERVRPTITKIGTAVKESVEFKPRELEIKMIQPEEITGKYSFEEGISLIRSSIGAESPEESLIKSLGLTESDTLKPKTSYTSEELEIFRKGAKLDGKKTDTLIRLERIGEKKLGEIETTFTPVRELRIWFSPTRKEPTLAFKVSGTKEGGFDLSLFSRARVEGAKGIGSRETLVKWYETTALVAKEPKEIDLTAKVISYRKIAPFFKKETTLGITMRPGLGRVIGFEGRRGAMIELRTPEMWHSVGFITPLSKKGWLVFEKRLDDVIKFKKPEIGKKKPSKPLKFEEKTVEDVFKPISKPESITKVVEDQIGFKPSESKPVSTLGPTMQGRQRTKLVLKEEEEYVRYMYPDISTVIPELVPRVKAPKVSLGVEKALKIGVRPRIGVSSKVATSTIEREIAKITTTQKKISDLISLKPPIQKEKPTVFELPKPTEMPGIGELTRFDFKPLPPVPDITPPPPPPKVATPLMPWIVKPAGKVVIPPIPIPGFGVGEKKARGRWKKQWYRKEWELFQKLFS